MGMEEALVARLKAAAGGKVAWGERPRTGGLPVDTLAYVAPGREWTHDGPARLDRARVQIDTWAETGPAALARSRTILAAMEAADSDHGWGFHPAQLEMRSGPEPDDLDGGGKVWRVMQDFTFYHEPTGA